MNQRCCDAFPENSDESNRPYATHSLTTAKMVACCRMTQLLTLLFIPQSDKRRRRTRECVVLSIRRIASTASDGKAAADSTQHQSATAAQPVAPSFLVTCSGSSPADLPCTCFVDIFLSTLHLRTLIMSTRSEDEYGRKWDRYISNCIIKVGTCGVPVSL